jgi:GAF domain-containing protein
VMPDTPAPKRRDDPFRWVLDVSTMIMVDPGERESMQRIARAVGEGMGVSGADILSYDPARGALVQEATWDLDGVSQHDLEFLGTVIPLDENPMFKRLIDSRSIEERHFDDPIMPDDETQMFAEWGYKTTLDAPLLVGGELVGALGVTESRYERRFMAMEVERFGKFAAMAAAAIRNARAFHRERRHSRQLDLLMEQSEILSASERAGAVLAAGAHVVAEGSRAAWVALYELPRGTDEPRLLSRQSVAAKPDAAATDPDTNAGCDPLPALRSALQTGEPVVVSTIDGGADETLRAEMLRAGDGAWLGLPLRLRGETIGLLALGWPSSHPSPEAEDVDFARAAGDLLAIALDNARLDGSLD